MPIPAEFLMGWKSVTIPVTIPPPVPPTKMGSPHTQPEQTRFNSPLLPPPPLRPFGKKMNLQTQPPLALDLVPSWPRPRPPPPPTFARAYPTPRWCAVLCAVDTTSLPRRTRRDQRAWLHGRPAPVPPVHRRGVSGDDGGAEVDSRK